MYLYFCSGELAEWSNALVLKTSVPQGTESSNLSFSATIKKPLLGLFYALHFHIRHNSILRICYVFSAKYLVNGRYRLTSGHNYPMHSNF